MNAPRPLLQSKCGIVAGLLLILLISSALRLRGIHWPQFHHDEQIIALWLARGEPDRAYAGGFFTLAKPFRWGWNTIRLLQHRFDQFRGLTEKLTPSPTDFILFARYFNVWLAACTCLLLYIAGKHLFGSHAYGLFSAALLALSQYHVEHSHYAETDIAMVFALSLALAAWIVSIATGRRRWFVLAALAGGFAGGTKFTLVSLWPAFLVFPMIGKFPGVFSNNWKTIGLGLFWTAALLIAGFTLATPSVTDWHEFWQSLAREGARVARETALNMGPLAADRYVRWSARLHDFARWSTSLGIAWLVLWAVSAPCFLAPSARRYIMPLVIAPLLFTVYWIFLSPWVRTQEFMVFIPFAALAAPWSAHLLHSTQKAFPRGLAWLACLVTLAQSSVKAIRVSSIFGWTDTRLSASQWIQNSGPDALFGEEKYVNVRARQGPAQPIRMVLHHKIQDLRDRGFDYVLRNGAEGDRGMVHPVTGRRYPEFEKQYGDFLLESERLRVFSPLPPCDTFTTFNSIRVELYGLHRFANWPALQAPLPQPARIVRDERTTLFPVGRHLGADTVMEVTRDGVTCGIGGPDELIGPVYAILYTRERPAEVIVNGLGAHHRVRLDPYDAAVLPLLRPAWKPRLSHFEIISARARPQKNIHRIPCYLRIAFSRAEARRILRELGIPISDTLGSTADWESSLAYVQRLELFERSSPQAFGVRDTSAWYYNQFARLYLTNGLSWTHGCAEGHENNNTVQIFFPIVRPPFACQLDFELSVYPENALSSGHVDAEFIDPLTSVKLQRLGMTAGQLTRVTLNLPPATTTELDLLLHFTEPVRLELGKAELTWNIKDVIRYETEQAQITHAEWLTRKGNADDARAYLAALRPPCLFVNQLRVAQLRFEATRIESEHEKHSAAKTLLAVAPNHLEALSYLAITDAAAREKLAVLTNAPANAVLHFGRFLTVRGGAFDNEKSAITFAVDVEQNAPPPLAIRLYQRRHGRWKSLEKTTIKPMDRRLLAAGERLLVKVPVGHSADPACLGFAVETDVRWQPGRLPVRGYADGIVPIQRLLQ